LPPNAGIKPHHDTHSANKSMIAPAAFLFCAWFHIPRFLAATPEAALDGRRILEVDASPDVD
jgi:hypothetical protein